MSHFSPHEEDDSEIHWPNYEDYHPAYHHEPEEEDEDEPEPEDPLEARKRIAEQYVSPLSLFVSPYRVSEV